MGLFDEVKIEPVIPELPYHIPEDYWGWQTKSFDDPMMQRYRIDGDGKLHCNLYEWKKDPEHPLGASIVTVGEEEVADFHGDIIMVGVFTVKDEPDREVWVELRARFTEGLLARIDVLSVEEKQRHSRTTRTEVVRK